MSLFCSKKQVFPRLAFASAVCAAAAFSSLTTEESWGVQAQSEMKIQAEERPEIQSEELLASPSDRALLSDRALPSDRAAAEPASDDAAKSESDASQSAPNESAPSQNASPISFGRAQTSLIQNAFIASPMAGVISNIAVTEGDLVTDGTPLVELRSDLAEKELIAAQAALQAALMESENDVDLRYARRTMEVRQNEMRQSRRANQTYAGAVSDMEIEELRLQVDQSALAMEQADHELRVAAAASVEKEAAVEIAQTRLEQHRVQTTVAGMVVEVDVERGEWVEAGKPLVRIISLDPIRVECLIDGRTYGRELVGRKAKFLPINADHELDGEITFVSPELHPVTGQVRLWATINNPDSKVGSGTTGKLIVQ